jgi:hypothetical protein
MIEKPLMAADVDPPAGVAGAPSPAPQEILTVKDAMGWLSHRLMECMEGDKFSEPSERDKGYVDGLAKGCELISAIRNDKLCPCCGFPEHRLNKPGVSLSSLLRRSDVAGRGLPDALVLGQDRMDQLHVLLTNHGIRSRSDNIALVGELIHFFAAWAKESAAVPAVLRAPRAAGNECDYLHTTCVEAWPQDPAS